MDLAVSVVPILFKILSEISKDRGCFADPFKIIIYINTNILFIFFQIGEIFIFVG